MLKKFLIFAVTVVVNFAVLLALNWLFDESLYIGRSIVSSVCSALIYFALLHVIIKRKQKSD